MERIDLEYDRVNGENVTIERLKVDDEKIPVRWLNKMERKGHILDWFIIPKEYRLLVIVWRGLTIGIGKDN